MKLSEKAAYLEGLFEGLNIDKTTPEGKILTEAVKIIGAMADEVVKLNEKYEDMMEYVEELDDDLSDVENDLYNDGGDPDDEDYDDDDDEDDEEDDEDDEDANFYEATCPSCGEVVCFDDTLDPESITCPACGEKFSCVCDGGCEDCEDACEGKMN